MESALVFGGIAVSLLVEFVKTKFSMTTTQVMALVVALSLAGGAAFFFLNMFGMWTAFIEVLASAGAFYAFIIRNIKTS